MEVRVRLPVAVAEWIDSQAGKRYKTRQGFMRDFWIALYQKNTAAIATHVARNQNRQRR